MREIGKYNTDLHLFQEKLPPVRGDVLLFQRWLVDNAKGEHLPYSKPTGEFAMALVIQDKLPVDRVVKSKQPQNMLEQQH